jgi:hypothetical protein
VSPITGFHTGTQIAVILRGAKEGVQKGAEGVKKGATTAANKTEDVGEAVGKGVKKGVETAIDKTEDVGEAVGKGVKDVFTDDDRDSDNDEGIAEGVRTTEPQQQSRPAAVSSTTESDTDSRELPATAGEQPLILLIGALGSVLYRFAQGELIDRKTVDLLKQLKVS